MRYVSPQLWSTGVLIAGAAAGAAGLLAEPMRALAVRAGLPAGLGIAVSANLLYPAAIIAAAIYFPRLRWVPAFVVVAILGFTITRCLVRDWHFWHWTPTFVVGVLHPVIVVGGVVAGLLATGVSTFVRAWRRVGWSADPTRCRACGYRLAGVEAARCPECGSGIGRRS